MLLADADLAAKALLLLARISGLIGGDMPEPAASAE
jgi:hypothetical protein